MSEEAYGDQDISYSSLQGSPLWLLMLSLNLFFNGVGSAIRDLPRQCNNTTGQDISGSIVVYGLSITLYLSLGIASLVINQFNAKCQTEGSKKKCVSNKTKMRKECTKLLSLINWWRVLRDTLVLVAGGLYLAGDNLELVAPLMKHPHGNGHMITYQDLRSILLGLSLVLSLVPTSSKLFSRGLTQKKGPAKPVLVGIWDMTTNRLFPMLMNTVQVDQIYTAIASEVVQHAKEMKDGTKCPKDYVTTGIVFFVAVSVIWVAVVCGVIGKHVCQLRRFNKKNRNKGSRHIVILLIFWPILALYTPAYIALNNRWPWICAAKCHLKEGCIENTMAMCAYVQTRTVLLFLLWGFTTFGPVVFYFISRCATMCGADVNTRVEAISSQIEESLRSRLQSNHSKSTLQEQLHESLIMNPLQENHNEITQHGHIFDNPHHEEETQF